VTHLRPGLLDVEASGDKLRARRDLVELGAGETLDLGDLPLFASHTIRGRCEGLLGKADACRIHWLALDPPPHRALRRHRDSATVQPDGTFVLSLAEGRYLLRASGAGGAVVEIDTRTLADGPLVLRLAAEAQLRLIVAETGAPPELTLFDGGNRDVWRRDLAAGWRIPILLPPGDYRAELRDARGRVETRRITLGPDGAELRVP
jgi:hypothetical protein